jgi:hypothetical protein
VTRSAGSRSPSRPAAPAYAIAVIALLSALVAWIAFRTVVLAVRGQLFPAWQRGVQGYRRGGRTGSVM